MAEIKPLYDGYGVIYEADKILPENLRDDFLKALAELEDNECHKKHSFPITRLHKVAGYKTVNVYRADIDKTSGWRLHLQYHKANHIALKDIIEGQKHDDVIKSIKSKKSRYE